MAAMWLPRGGVAMIVVTAMLAALTVLSHNVTVAVFVLALLAAVPALSGWASGGLCWSEAAWRPWSAWRCISCI